MRAGACKRRNEDLGDETPVVRRGAISFRPSWPVATTNDHYGCVDHRLKPVIDESDTPFGAARRVQLTRN
jgi:hypothetical protein